MVDQKKRHDVSEEVPEDVISGLFGEVANLGDMMANESGLVEQLMELVNDYDSLCVSMCTVMSASVQMHSVTEEKLILEAYYWRTKAVLVEAVNKNYVDDAFKLAISEYLNDLRVNDLLYTEPSEALYVSVHTLIGFLRSQKDFLLGMHGVLEAEARLATENWQSAYLISKQVSSKE